MSQLFNLFLHHLISLLSSFQHFLLSPFFEKFRNRILHIFNRDLLPIQLLINESAQLSFITLRLIQLNTRQQFVRNVLTRLLILVKHRFAKLCLDIQLFLIDIDQRGPSMPLYRRQVLLSFQKQFLFHGELADPFGLSDLFLSVKDLFDEFIFLLG